MIKQGKIFTVTFLLIYDSFQYFSNLTVNRLPLREHPYQIECLVLLEEVGVHHQVGEVVVGVQHQVGEEEVVGLLQEQEEVEEGEGAQHYNLQVQVEVEVEAAVEERHLEHQEGEGEGEEEVAQGQRQGG